MATTNNIKISVNVNNNGNNAEFVWDNFKRMFPDMAANVVEYTRTGSRMIALSMNDGTTLSFLYYTPTNWNFGTKPWRMKPKAVEEAEKNKERPVEKKTVMSEKIEQALSNEGLNVDKLPSQGENEPIEETSEPPETEACENESE